MEKFNFSDIPIDAAPHQKKEISNSSVRELSTRTVVYNFQQELNLNKNKPDSREERKKRLMGVALLALGALSTTTYLQKDELPQNLASSSAEDSSLPKISNPKLEIVIGDLQQSEALTPTLKPTESASPEKIDQHTPSIEMQELAHEIQVRAHQLLRDENFFPKKLFTDNFFLAVQIQESQLKRDAQSSAGAQGIMQVKPITIKEVVRYLNILENKNDVEFDGPPMHKLSPADINDLLTLINNNGDLGRAFGKLYFAELFNHFDIGKDIYAQGGITKARKKLLVAYNWNPADFKKNETQEKAWPLESQNYYKKIFRYMKILEKIQLKMNSMQMLSKIEDLSPILAIELKKYERELDEKHPQLDDIIEKIIADYLEKISQIEQLKQKKLTPAEIERLIKNFNSLVYRNYKNLFATNS